MHIFSTHLHHSAANLVHLGRIMATGRRTGRLPSPARAPQSSDSAAPLPPLLLFLLNMVSLLPPHLSLSLQKKQAKQEASPPSKQVVVLFPIYRRPSCSPLCEELLACHHSIPNYRRLSSPKRSASHTFTMRRVCKDLPHPVEFTEHLYITLKDGAKLAARLFHPVGASKDQRYPGILEYIPYRKRNGTRTRDEPMHGFFAGNGYVSVRVDMRGSGESDGLLYDEYLKQEQDDALEVIDWISKQPWCTGAVGMMGKSWSGFNSLQVAARRPPALKAIIVLGFTANRFTDDIHWKGGCLLNDNFWWGCVMQGFQSSPPDPKLVGADQWKAMWLQRLEEMPFNAADWASHQCYDDYWRHGSVCEDFDAIEVPVLLVDGWADSYTNALFHLLEHLKVPCRAICGPWVHAYPQDGTPLPQMNFLREAVGWWDHWMKDMKGNGAMEGPALQAYVEDSLPPCTSKPVAPGKWVGLEAWPSKEIETSVYHLGQCGQLQKACIGGPAPSGLVQVHTPLNHGLLSGEWMGAGVLGETAGDQRMDNGMAVTYTTQPLECDMAILGQPVFEVMLTCDKQRGFLFAQLCDVAPDGAATRITYGMKNLVHCGVRGDRAISAVTPGTPVQVQVSLDYTGYCVPAGHRLTLSLANNYWPMVWCSPEDTTLVLDTATATFSLPLLPAMQNHVIAGPDPSPEVAPPTPVTVLTAGRVDRSLHYDIVTDTWTCITDGVGGVFGEGIYRFDDIDTTIEHNLRRELVLCNRDPLSAHYTIDQRFKMSRPWWVADVTIKSTQTGDLDYLHLRTTIKAKYNDDEVFEKNWYRRVRRDAI